MPSKLPTERGAPGHPPQPPRRGSGREPRCVRALPVGGVSVRETLGLSVQRLCHRVLQEQQSWALCDKRCDGHDHRRRDAAKKSRSQTARGRTNTALSRSRSAPTKHRGARRRREPTHENHAPHQSLACQRARAPGAAARAPRHALARRRGGSSRRRRRRLRPVRRGRRRRLGQAGVADPAGEKPSDAQTRGVVLATAAAGAVAVLAAAPKTARASIAEPVQPRRRVRHPQQARAAAAADRAR